MDTNIHIQSYKPEETEPTQALSLILEAVEQNGEYTTLYCTGDDKLSYQISLEPSALDTLINVNEPPTLFQPIANAWTEHYNKHGVHAPEAVSFEYEGVEVVNPFTSVCGRFYVNPVTTYGATNFVNWCTQVKQLLKRVTHEVL